MLWSKKETFVKSSVVDPNSLFPNSDQQIFFSESYKDLDPITIFWPKVS
jgi:hypothetical protein